jgi:uncharacterized membrane protein
MSKRLRIFFTVSIALNIVLLGIVGGDAYRRWQDSPWWEVREEVSPENQNKVASTFQSAFRDIRTVSDEARKIRAEIVTILSAEKFDKGRFEDAIRRLAVTRNKIAAIKVKATRDLAEALSQQERAKMAERMARMVGGGMERHVDRGRRPVVMTVKMMPPPPPPAE